ncbi:oxygen-dependent protoporphyrinogen oxidase [Cryobacterium sp. MP_M5]|uniref:protoporphyrinogen/coproporphyrinogen oxidase n=1 Tax=unclassified Cryobacterium TaxID=2649013 RepID=UPI0018C8F434|nr:MULTISPECIES: FAD-dependent oxidoreductase [unclassified Cryobacterium]MBG6059188.1 oxygen-dependent protoporphyrinogen oxidase [Cryobacterium sp. MP_M3]MEC5177482.1 oxygen-dependent protoporphyrinogen oxidase [Cryobacterium sp. MP_M5]
MQDVIVIGGGVAGLVAARACARVGLTVTVLEATPAVGGAVARHEVAGLTLDSGAESFAVRRNAVAEFVDSLGLTGDVVAPNPAGAWLHLPDEGPGGGSISVPLPQAGVLGIPGSPLADDVRRVIGWSGAWRAYLDRLMPVLTIGREHSLGDLVRKRMGRRVLERLVEPVTAGVYSSAADDLEIDVVAPGLNAALTTAGSLSGAVLSLRSAAPAGSAVAGLRGGMSRLVAALVADLDHFGVEIVTDAPVTTLQRAGVPDEAGVPDGAGVTDDGAQTWVVRQGVPAEVPAADQPDGSAAEPAEPAAPPATRDREARFVILATPGAPALRLVSGLSPELAALAGLDWPQTTAVELATIVLDAPQLDAHPRGTGALVAAGTPGVTAKALTHATAKWDWLAEAAGPGRHVIRLSYGRAGAAGPTVDLSDPELLALALRDASAIFGVDLDAGLVRGFARTVWGDALSPATIGAPGRVRQVRAAVEATPGLELSGAWLAGTGLASVIPDALAAAGRVRHAALGI